ncbi:MAG: BON domain-containing protein [Planctomycetaceae bacterium]
MYRLTTVLTVLSVCACASEVQAQLFGKRTLGRSISRRPGASPPAMDQAGTVTSDRRFVRGQRDRTDFVGSDRGDSATFVGAAQGQTQGTVTSSTAGLREQTRRIVNLPRGPQSTTGVYLPRLSLHLATAAPTTAAGRKQNLSRQYRELRSRSTDSSPDDPQPDVRRRFITRLRAKIEVSLEGRVATLHGVAASEHDRRLAGLLATFEPGIDSVNNQIRVQTGSGKSAL